MTMRVVIYQDGLLSYSETFIKKQAVGLTQWKPILLGHKFTRNGLPLAPLEAHLLIPESASPLRRFIYTARRFYKKVDSLGLKTLKSLAPDLLHAHFGTSAVDIWPYAKALNIPMLVTLHGFDINIYKEHWNSGKRSKRRKHYPQQLLALAQEPNVHFLAVSTAIKKRALAYGIPEHKISISYIGIDTDEFTPATDDISARDNKILYVGRLVDKKGSPYLIEAFAQTKKIVPDAQLIIVGKGALEEKLKQQVAELKLADVHFMGALTSQQVKDQLNQCKIFCLPSITANNGDAEGLPISILEAQASGVIVVSSSSGGIGDNLLNNETCFTFPEKDVNTLAAILTDKLQHTDQYKQVIDQQQQLINNKFQLKNCIKDLEALYTQYGK